MYELKIVRERASGPTCPRVIRSPGEVYEVFHERFAELDRELFAVVLLDGRNAPIGFNIVSIGSLTAALVHPREVFKPAILANAAAIILVHNHPSGQAEPSAEDRALTERLEQAGELIGIRVLDHVIIGDGQYRSKGEGW